MSEDKNKKKKKPKVVKQIKKRGAILLDGDINKKGSTRISKEEFESRHGGLKGHLKNVDVPEADRHQREEQTQKGAGTATKL